MTSKRHGVEPQSVVHVMHYTRMVMENDPFNTRPSHEEDRNFLAIFRTVTIITYSEVALYCNGESHFSITKIQILATNYLMEKLKMLFRC